MTMSSFSPYIYHIASFENVDLSNISKYYDNFTFLEKPDKRNAYKVSLAQMLHYLVDFGIGYNSVCVTVLTDAQEFNSCRYVNRHGSTSDKRPATIADLKSKINTVVRSMINTVVNMPNGDGLYDNNNIFPSYFFTQDRNLTPLKIKQLTGYDYVEVEFDDFAFTASSAYAMPQFPNGYVTPSKLRSCPRHTHEVNNAMTKSISYSWKSGLHPQAHTMWSGHANQSGTTKFQHYNYDPWIAMNNVKAVKNFGEKVEASIECSPSWDKPASVSCYMNDPGRAVNNVTVNGENFVSIRYPGRRYRLFKRVN